MALAALTELYDETESAAFEAIASITSQSKARDLVQELWGAGFTISRRQYDPFDVPEKSVPRGMSYQWCVASDRARLTAQDWKPVPFLRHDGAFAPVGQRGDIEVGGLVLLERPKSDVDAAHAERIAKAHKNVDDWIEKTAGGGLVGGVRTWADGEKPPVWRMVGDPTTAQNIIPKEPEPEPQRTGLWHWLHRKIHGE